MKKSPNNWVFDKQQFETIDLKRIVYFATSLLSFLLTEAGRFIYRPYIYENNINDFGIADSVGNWGGIVVQIFCGLAILNSTYIKGLRLIGFFVTGYILYEIIQPILPKGTFDWLDIYGTLIGGVIGLIIYMFIHLRLKENKVFYTFN